MEQLPAILITGLLALVVALSWQLRTRISSLNALKRAETDLATEVARLQARLGGIVDLDTERANVSAKLGEAQKQLATFEDQTAQKRKQLENEYETAVARYSSLKAEISLLEENLEDISFGVYKPHFSFTASEAYKTALESAREKARQIVRDGLAATCPISWTVGNSQKEGTRMVRLNSKLLLRAFNGECEAALANVRWNNVVKMEERVRKSYEAINKLSDVLQVTIAAPYLNLKLDELRLTYEYEQKHNEEREEQRRVREQIREEEKAQREIERVKEEAEGEEARFQKALEKARAEAALATGAQLQKLIDQVSTFEAKLDEARKKKERAIARAQLTKSGFVYVISNIGAFGERVFKIGMTRRLEPMERVVELGDASVPFPFDLHAMLYSDNAPELECSLHRLFEDRRLNLVNARREFYHEVDLNEIEAFVRERGLSAQFTHHPEAKEYRESNAIRVQRSLKPTPKVVDQYVSPLFQLSSGPNHKSAEGAEHLVAEASHAASS